MASPQTQTVVAAFKGMGDLLWAAPLLSAELDRGHAVHLLLLPNPALIELCALIDFGPNRLNLHLHSLPASLAEIPRFLLNMHSLSPELIWISPHAPLADSSWKVPLGLRALKLLFWPDAQLTGIASERLSRLFDRSLKSTRNVPLRYRDWNAYNELRRNSLPAEPPIVRLDPQIAAHGKTLLYDLAIFPGASATNRRWPAAKYPALLAALPPHWKIAVIGLPADLQAVQSVLPASRSIHYLTGTLLQSLQLLASARLLLVMDSGAMHFAEVLGIPAVAIFGQQHPTSVIVAGIVNPIYRQTVPCQPCNRAVCSQPELYCLTNLDPIEVARHLIAKSAADPAPSAPH